MSSLSAVSPDKECVDSIHNVVLKTETNDILQSLYNGVATRDNGMNLDDCGELNEVNLIINEDSTFTR